MNPDTLENNEWDFEEDARYQTGERRVVVPTEPPSEREERTTLLDELEAPFSAPEPEALPTQPDLGDPPLPAQGVLESYIDQIDGDEDDLRDTIPAPVPPEEP